MTKNTPIDFKKSKGSVKKPKPRASASRSNSRSSKVFSETVLGRFCGSMLRVLKIGVRLSLFVLAVGAISYGGYKTLPYLNPEIKQVVITGDLQRLDRNDLAEKVRGSLDGGLLTLDMSNLSSKLDSVPWVRKVELIKYFPNTLEVKVYEEQALAQWNNSGYISFEGEFIRSILYEDLMGLPQLSSERVSTNQSNYSVADEESTAVAMSLFHRLNSVVLAEGQQIQALSESVSGGWTMVWNNGLSIDLGRSNHLLRTRHAMATWQRLPEDIRDSLDRIDARYDNGVAIRTQKNTTVDVAASGNG